MAEAQQSGASPEDTVATLETGRKGIFESKKNGKSRVQDGENAPLLQDSGHRDADAPEYQDSEGGSPSLHHRVACFLKQSVIWTLENLLIVVLACLLAAGTVAVLIHHNDRPVVQGPTPVCTTAGCVLAASELLHNISPDFSNLDPCDDFRTYVCEGWDMRHDLRSDQSDVFTGTIMNEDSQILLRHVLESPFSKAMANAADASAIDQENFEKIQDAYNACMAESSIKKRASSPLLQILYKLEEIFPVKRPYQGQERFPKMEMQHQKGLFYTGETALSNAISYLMEIGVDAMLSLGVDADDKDPDSTIVMVMAPWRPGLPSKEYYRDDNVIRMYKSTIAQVLEGLLQEASPNTTILASWQNQEGPESGLGIKSEVLVDALVDFEKQLAEASPDPEDAQDVTKYYNPLTLEAVRALLPQVSIPYLISSRTSNFSPDKIIVGSPSYLKAVSAILSRASKQTIQAYLVWKTVQVYGINIESDAIKPLQRFNNQLGGKDPEVKEERWRTCVKHVDRGLGWILSKFYIEKAFSIEAKDFGDLIVSDIKDQFIKKLGAAEWMSPEVRQLGINKVHNIVQKIGYPTISPDIRNPKMLQDYYETININETAFFENTVSITVAAVKREWAKAGKPTNRDEWGMTASTVNAYYNPAGNEIVFPAGIMQSPVFYDPKVPQYLSYGAFGSVSGHELSHAFDSSGRHYDQRGNFTGWWDNSTIQAFKDKAECFVEQYHSYSIPGPDGQRLHVNGRLTLGENIADAGGVTAAFQAWKEREATSPSDLLPGLQNFSKEQLFFISYGNWWCGKTRKEQAINRVYTDPHSPNFARILGTMANSREFKESFQCKEKEPVCELW
ncbi:hypothetical protein MMC15_005717 [Xylographa vitiligo]|nr:hypothetical protein [Xylographa vitiligo]